MYGWAVIVCFSLWALHYVFYAAYFAAVDYAAGVSVVACAYDCIVFDYYCAEFASVACASFGYAEGDVESEPGFAALRRLCWWFFLFSLRGYAFHLSLCLEGWWAMMSLPF